jgi:putative IMPACT (imprinted ancient) family translation regulator
MCDVLVKLTGRFKTLEEKKAILGTKRLEVTQSIHNAVILFVFTQNKNAKKTLDRYKKKHPKAVEIVV